MKAGPEQRGRRRVAVVAAIAGLAATMAVVQVAPAVADVPDHELVIEISDINANQTRSVPATCPAGKDLIGMGGAVVGGGGNVLIESIVPDLTTETVVVSAREGRWGWSDDWYVKATAVCADQGSVPGRYLVDDETSSLTGQPSASADAACDPGDRLLGAGFELSGAPGRLHLTTLLPTEDAVIAAGEEDSIGTSALWQVKVIGLCAALFDSQVHRDENRGLTNSRASTAGCPTDFEVTGGGGFINDGPNSTGYVALIAFNLGDMSTGASYMTVGSTEPRPGTTADTTLSSYVLCADLR
jgi:hypothetical protein